jgi:hypothetical protein
MLLCRLEKQHWIKLMDSLDVEYLQIVLKPLYVCAHYRPKFGQGAKGGGLTLSQFQALYQGDPFYSWFGLDNPLMYAAHKAAGGMTSIYRQLGIGCEALFRRVLQDSLGLSNSDVRWSYEIPLPNGKSRTLHLDGRISLDSIQDPDARKRFHDWMAQAALNMGINQKIFQNLTGTVFEVRQGYKSKDSKRQNADIANAATAYTKAYMPCAVILSTQIDADILLRYRAEKWVVITGIVGVNDPLVSTYDFMRDIVGYDFANFFQRNSQALRSELDKVLQSLLTPGTT